VRFENKKISYYEKCPSLCTYYNAGGVVVNTKVVGAALGVIRSHNPQLKQADSLRLEHDAVASNKFLSLIYARTKFN
jgi:hypothetical protein